MEQLQTRETEGNKCNLVFPLIDNSTATQRILRPIHWFSKVKEGTYLFSEMRYPCLGFES